MSEILTLLQCAQEPQNRLMIKRLSRVMMAMLVMSGRITMLGISRWGGDGCSYRNVQRVFYGSIEWSKLMWALFKTHLYEDDEEYMLIGDKTIVTKAGKHTHGIDRFFSSVHERPVRSLCFLVLALGAVKGNWACPIDVSQVIRTAEDKANLATGKGKEKAVKGTPKVKRPPGRPKGSKNKDKSVVELSSELIRLKEALSRVLGLIAPLLKVRYLLLDGEYGHHAAVQMALQLNLQLISKLRCDSSLFLPFSGEYSGHGRKAKYGARLDFDQLPESALVSTELKDGYATSIYQLAVWHKLFSDKLNVVIIVKVHLSSQKRGHVILFSSDLSLSAERIIRAYSLRFQIEFVFRDAKQHFGLEDFMNVTPTAVKNAANLSFLMTILACCLLKTHRADCPSMHILDLKTVFRGQFFAARALKMLPQQPDTIIFERIIVAIASLGRIHKVISPVGDP